MKKLSFSMFAMAGLLLASCADKDVIGESGQQGEVRSEGYMSLSINLPTTPSTRAANDVFDDGDPEEYKVNNCALLLFEGDNEASAELIDAQKDLELKDKTGATASPDNITESYKVTLKVNNFSGKKKLWALALLNYDNVLSSIGTGEDEGVPVLKTTNGEVRIGKKTKLATLRTYFTKANLLGESKDNFFMTNAILSKVPGGDETTTAPTKADVFQLAELDPTKIFETPQLALDNPAGDIIVERAVAKATLRLAGEGMKIGDEELAIKNVSWTIDNMEPTTYIFRHPGGIEGKEADLKYFGYSSEAFDPETNYRFVGFKSTQKNTALGSAKKYYRSYWCVDPQYSIPANTTPAYNPYTYDSEYNFSNVKDDKAFYCYENTFDVENQSYRNTTRAIIKVELGDETAFYTVNGGQERLIGEQGKAVATSRVMTFIVGMTAVQDAFTAQLVEKEGGEETSYTVSAASFATPKFERNVITGQLELKELKVSDDVKNGATFVEGAEGKINDALEALLKTINENIVVFEYKGGVMYYEARFMHFAAGSLDDEEDLAPWNIWESETNQPGGGSTENAYKDGTKTRDENYLGRYGMVRNNWYDVVITSFDKLGYPEIPSVEVKNPGYEDPDTPDDNLKEYLSVKIHVLSWAKRTQGWIF